MSEYPPVGEELDRLVNAKVFGHPDEGQQVDSFSTNIADAWEIVEEMTSRMGYQSPGFTWHGPLFKPEDKYRTAEGYPLGTTCWYVYVEAHGLRKWVCAGAPELAICHAALWVVEEEAKA